MAVGRGAAVLLFATMAVWTLQRPPTRNNAPGDELTKRVWPSPTRLTRIAVVDCGTTLALLAAILLIPSPRQPHAAVATIIVGSILGIAFYLFLLAHTWSSAPSLAPVLEATPEQLALIGSSGLKLRRWTRPELMSWSIRNKRLTLRTTNDANKRPTRLSIRYYDPPDVEALLHWFGLPATTANRRGATP
jgi:hypothetical protein